jgi:membrane-bound metal-dependent hydrolase YbcI (DUF457 family)
MEPVTHTLASIALAQAGLNRTTRLAVPISIVAGLAADMDLLSLAGGAPAYLAYHRTFTHSFLGAAAIAAIVPLPFLAIGSSGWYRRQFVRDGELRREDAVRWRGAALTCCAAALLHLLLDGLNPYGLQLLWPLERWHSLEFLDPVDPWLLLGLLVILLLPVLLRMVIEEIGARREQTAALRGAVLALAFLFAYCGARWLWHARAVDLLMSHSFHDALPRRASAYPASASPMHWMGIVETENTLEELEFRLASFFDSDRSSTNYKPEPTAAVAAARATPAVQKFLAFARYPSAALVVLPEGRGVRVEIRDLRFTRPAGAEVRRDVIAIVELDPQNRVVRDALIWAKDYQR